MQENFKTRPALGSSGENWLGCLYDCSEEKIIPNVRVNREIATSYLNQSSNKLCSVEDIYSELDIDLDTRLNAELGILEVEGFNESILKSKNTQKYRSGMFFVNTYKTKIANITIERESILQQLGGPQSLQSGTHLISGITYGSTIIYWTSDQDTLKGICHGADSLDDLEEGARLYRECRGIYFSDAFGSSQEGTFLDVLQHMKSVEDTLRESPEIATRPFRLHLYPIKNLQDEGAEKRFIEIQSDEMMRILGHFQDMQEVEDRFQQLQSRECMKASPFLTTTATKFMDLFLKNKKEVLECLQKLVPDIHNSKAEEEELKTLLMMVEDSPFNKKTSIGWLQRKEKEANKLEEIIQKLSDIPRLQSQTDLKTKLALYVGYEIFCLKIHIPMTDETLEEMKIHLEEGYEEGDNADVKEQLIDSSYSDLNNTLEIFYELWAKKKNTNTVKCFVVFDKGDMATLSGVISFYKGKKLVKKNFIPMAIPDQLQTREVTDTSIELEWRCLWQEEDVFKICIQQPDTEPKYVDCAEKSLVIEDLIPQTLYQIRVCKVQRSLESDYSDVLEVTTEKLYVTSRPPKPACYGLSPEIVHLQWERPERVSSEISSYSIFDAEGKSQEVDGQKTSFQCELIPNYKYQFAVQANCGTNGCSRLSPLSNPFEKKMSDDELRKEKLLKNCDLISGHDKCPKVYQLKLKYHSYDGIVQCCEFGSPSTVVEEKVVMLLGATGSGKTLLVNGMANYIVGSKWEDDFRIRLIPEEEKAANQAQSQTTMITAYTIHHQEGFHFPYTVTLIDTPGFGDTSGVKRDQEIISNIDKFFRGGNRFEHLDAVGFVAQSSLARLTPTQRYIFDSILSLFGKDIEENIFPLLTFADGHQPNVLSALEEANIPCSVFFKFNNSAVYADNQCTNEIEGSDKKFWELGKKGVARFLFTIKDVTPKSLKLTKEVLEAREKIQCQVEGINKDIKHCLHKIEMLTGELWELENHERDIEGNKNFTYTVEDDVKELEPNELRKNTTNCKKCKQTCHYPCKQKTNNDKVKCMKMKNKICTQCNCSYELHHSSNHHYVITRKLVEKTYDELKKRYHIAQDEKETKEKIIRSIKKDIEDTRKKISLKVVTVRDCISHLCDIALKPNPLSTAEYVQMLIDAEKNEGRQGWHDRCIQLNDVKETAVLIEYITSEGYDPLKDHDKILQHKQLTNLPMCNKVQLIKARDQISSGK